MCLLGIYTTTIIKRLLIESEVLVICLLNSAMYQIILFMAKSMAKSPLCSTYLLNNEIRIRVLIIMDYMTSVSLYLTLRLFI